MARYQIDFYSKSLLRRVDIRVNIPSNNLHDSISMNDDYYERREEKFPLVVFLCGFGENQVSWQTNTMVDLLLEKNKVAAIFVNGENKWYLNLSPIEKWYDFIENDILDFVYGNFRNVSRDMPLMIVGNSMGGYGALYHYLKNPSKYQACCALSPATKPDSLDEYKFGTLKELFLANKDKKLNCYISVGDKDFIIDASKEFDKFLLDNGIDARYTYVKDYDHSWNLWKEEIYIVFDYFRKLGLIK